MPASAIHSSAAWRGNVVNDDMLGSMEFGCAASGAKVILVVGHTACGAVKGAIDDVVLGNLTGLLARIKPAIAATKYEGEKSSKNYAYVDAVAATNVTLTMATSASAAPSWRTSRRKAPSPSRGYLRPGNRQGDIFINVMRQRLLVSCEGSLRHCPVKRINILRASVPQHQRRILGVEAEPDAPISCRGKTIQIGDLVEFAGR